MRFGPKQSLEPLIRKIEEICATHPMGVDVVVKPVKLRYTREEENGFHWLLRQWVKMENGNSTEKAEQDKKDYVLMKYFGFIHLFDKHGNDVWLPARTTTRQWQWGSKPGYVPCKLSKSDYAELIDATKRMAADDGVVLPELEKEA